MLKWVGVVSQPHFWDLGASCASLWQGWDKWNQPLGHGHKEEGTWMCRVTMVPLPGHHPTLSLIAREVGMCHPGSGCPMAQGGHLTMGDGTGGSHFHLFCPFLRALLHGGKPVSHWMCAGMDAGKKGKASGERRRFLRSRNVKHLLQPPA